MRKSGQKECGKCKLTGQFGAYVKSHLIPRALTLPRSGGLPFAQIGNRNRPVRRNDSWYDRQLVIREGEDILTSYDTWGISELRRLKLIWQSWGPMERLITADYQNFDTADFGIRKVNFSDHNKMRLFLLSILWRAGATQLPDFGEVQIKASDLRRLRRHLLDRSVPPKSFFPVTLTQLSTRGQQHNLSPIFQIRSGGKFWV